MRVISVGVVLVLATVAAVAGEQRMGPTIEIEDLGTFPDGALTIPVAINNRGEIVGSSVDSQGRNIAFLWTRRLGFEKLLANAAARDINNRGQVVGTTFECDPRGNCLSSGFVWTRSNGIRVLPGFVPTAINDRGEMVGFCPGAVFDEHRACALIDGSIFSPSVGTLGFATGINARGMVAVNVDDRAYLWWPRKGTLVRLEAEADVNVLAFAINDRGMILALGSDFAALWTKRSGFVASVAGAYATGLNNRGVVAGALRSHAMVWAAGRDIIDLATVEGEQSQAYDVNDRGQVVGIRTPPENSGETRAVIWRVRR
jgi:uncharacterized membrane protein